MGIRSSVNDMLAFSAVMNRYDEEEENEPQQPLQKQPLQNPLRGVGAVWNPWWTRPIDDGFENDTA
jgi:hypothetical protein